jgi:hypothetical protein
MFVEISGSTGGFNGKFKITVTSTTAFTYTMTEFPDGLKGTPVANYSAHAQRAIVYAATGNSADVSIGPDSSADYKPIPSGTEFLIQCPNGAKFDLADWYIKSSAASQNVSILYV